MHVTYSGRIMNFSIQLLLYFLEKLMKQESEVYYFWRSFKFGIWQLSTLTKENTLSYFPRFVYFWED